MALPELRYEDEGGNIWTLQPPYELTYFRVIVEHEFTANVTNAARAETAMFGSHGIVEFGITHIPLRDFHALGLGQSLSSLVMNAQSGRVFGVAFDLNNTLTGTLTADVPVLSISFPVDGFSYVHDDYYTVQRSLDGRWETKRYYESTSGLYPSATQEYKIGDRVRSWGYWPNLLWVGGGVNEAYDETGLYVSFHAKGRIIVDPLVTE